MHVYYADDSFRRDPNVPGMGPLQAIGGIGVDAAHVESLEAGLEQICSDFRFPIGEQFKWSPGKRLWMHDGLVGIYRCDFFERVLTLVSQYGAWAIVAVVDTSNRTATDAKASYDFDAWTLFMERANSSSQQGARIILSTPSGGKAETQKLHKECERLWKKGTIFCSFNNIVEAPRVERAKSHRLLQVADLVVSATAAAVSGNRRYAVPLFQEMLLPLFRRLDSRVGGRSLKIHPDYKFRNIYHYLCGDTSFGKADRMVQLPSPGMYFNEPHHWESEGVNVYGFNSTQPTKLIEKRSLAGSAA